MRQRQQRQQQRQQQQPQQPHRRRRQQEPVVAHENGVVLSGVIHIFYCEGKSIFTMQNVANTRS